MKRDAEIGEAGAQKEATIQASTSRREGEWERLANDVQIANAERDLAVKKAQYKAETEREQAKADLARQLQEAEINQELRKKQVAVEEAEPSA